jgi:hypothetical protein
VSGRREVGIMGWRWVTGDGGCGMMWNEEMRREEEEEEEVRNEEWLSEIKGAEACAGTEEEKKMRGGELTVEIMYLLPRTVRTVPR